MNVSWSFGYFLYQNLQVFCRCFPEVFWYSSGMFFLSGKLKKRTQIIFARNNTHKGFSNCSSSSPKKYTVIHKTLITAAFSRRFRFVSVRRRFVICDLLLRERQIYRSFAREKSLSSPLFTQPLSLFWARLYRDLHRISSTNTSAIYGRMFQFFHILCVSFLLTFC